MERKKAIRQRILKIRNKQNDEERQFKTERITKTVTAHPWFVEADSVCCYVDFRGEAGTRRIIECAWELEKEVYVPAVRENKMDFYRIFSFAELEEGSFGISEPGKNLICHERKRKEISGGQPLMIMPGVAFDRKRNRIGYGGGYYDRYLAAHPGFHTMAIAFECQVTEEIEAEDTDIKPELLVTERRIL